MVVRFTKSARNHRIGRRHALHVIDNPTAVLAGLTSPEGEELFMYLGTDETGRPLEVGLILEGDDIVVIHVMPMRKRWRNR